MAGHSKFKNIQYRKGAQDKKRAKQFAKIGREIQIAVKIGGSDPESNPRLRLAINNARSVNMPKDNVDRAINKNNSDTTDYNEVRYEGYGPFGTAFIVEALTDNKNRTASNIRTIFQKSGGNLGTQGSASHNFSQIGVIKIDKKVISYDSIFELAIEAGAEECISKDNFHEIHCSTTEIYNIKKELEKEISNFISTEIEWIPLNSIKIPKEKNEDLISFFELLEDDDDVQNVYSNVEFGD